MKRTYNVPNAKPRLCQLMPCIESISNWMSSRRTLNSVGRNKQVSAVIRRCVCTQYRINGKYLFEKIRRRHYLNRIQGSIRVKIYSSVSIKTQRKPTGHLVIQRFLVRHQGFSVIFSTFTPRDFWLLIRTKCFLCVYTENVDYCCCYQPISLEIA